MATVENKRECSGGWEEREKNGKLKIRKHQAATTEDGKHSNFHPLTYFPLLYIMMIQLKSVSISFLFCASLAVVFSASDSIRKDKFSHERVKSTFSCVIAAHRS